MGKTRQVIIGNSAAGLNAVKAIRRFDTSCQVTVISVENCLAYSPVLLPYYISGKIKRNEIIIADRSFYKQNAIELRLGKEAISVDSKNQRVLCKDESIVEYDNLLIASGASPKKLDAVGEHRAKVMTLRTMDDAQRILEASKNVRHILICGAGLASLEIANALQKRDRKITVMAKSTQILSRNADLECANIIQKEIEKGGISFLLGRDVTEVRPCNGRIRVSTDRNDKITVDVVIVGKGVDPNIQFLSNTGIKADRGILVNEKMETNISNVYAAGDVAQVKSLITSDYQLFANWPSACIEGRIAGLNMVGHKTELPGEVGYNILPIFNRTAAFMGETRTNSSVGEILKFYNEKGGVYRKLLLKEGKIIGAVLLGAFQDAGIILNLITKRVDVSLRKNELASHPISWGKIVHDVTTVS